VEDESGDQDPSVVDGGDEYARAYSAIQARKFAAAVKAAQVPPSNPWSLLALHPTHPGWQTGGKGKVKPFFAKWRETKLYIIHFTYCLLFPPMGGKWVLLKLLIKRSILSLQPKTPCA